MNGTSGELVKPSPGARHSSEHTNPNSPPQAVRPHDRARARSTEPPRAPALHPLPASHSVFLGLSKGLSALPPHSPPGALSPPLPRLPSDLQTSQEHSPWPPGEGKSSVGRPSGMSCHNSSQRVSEHSVCVPLSLPGTGTVCCSGCTLWACPSPGDGACQGTAWVGAVPRVPVTWLVHRPIHFIT